MSDNSDILIHVIEENWAQARQSEDQRATLASLVVIIASAIQGGLTQTGFTAKAIPLTIMLIIIGSFGMFASAKLYERWRYSMNSAKKLRTRLEDLYPETHLQKLLDAASEEHRKQHPFLANKLKLYIIWIVLHGLITALGIAYTLIILFSL